MARGVLSALAKAASTYALTRDQENRQAKAEKTAADLRALDQSNFERSLSSRENESALERALRQSLAESGQNFTAGENALNRSFQANQTTSSHNFTAGQNELDRNASSTNLGRQLSNALAIAGINANARNAGKDGLTFNDQQQLADDFKKSKSESFLSRAADLMAGAGGEDFGTDVRDKVLVPNDPASIRSNLGRDTYSGVAAQITPLLDSLSIAQGTPSMDLAKLWNYPTLFPKPELPMQPRQRGAGTGDLHAIEDAQIKRFKDGSAARFNSQTQQWERVQ